MATLGGATDEAALPSPSSLNLNPLNLIDNVAQEHMDSDSDAVSDDAPLLLQFDFDDRGLSVETSVACRERGVESSSSSITVGSLSTLSTASPVSTWKSWWSRMLAFVGPGYLIAVGYMDPGNWATDLEGGSKYGYSLLFVILLSNLAAMFLQSLAARLGIVLDKDLAQACKDNYAPRFNLLLYILAEIAIIATDLAEVIGSAIALQFIFGWPLWLGVLITTLDVFVIMAGLSFSGKGSKLLEILVLILVLIVGSCFAVELYYTAPPFVSMLQGLLPTTLVITDPDMLFVALSIMGATVMPHNLYLHSSLVRNKRNLESQQKDTLNFATLDICFALLFAFFVNAAILVVAAAALSDADGSGITELSDAHGLLIKNIGPGAGFVFAIALLAAGQSSTVTGTLAGQVVMEGFLGLTVTPWIRRLITRATAIIPAMAVALAFGNEQMSRLLIWSQVILSLQLSFAVFPLVHLTGSQIVMGKSANSALVSFIAWFLAVLIAFLNVIFLLHFIGII